MSAVLTSDAAEPVELFVVSKVLTADRFSEAARAVWPEIVDRAALWVLPPDRMQTGA